MAHTSTGIANAFLRLADGNLTQMQLQKLAYIAHGWNLAINGQPLIAEPVRAWPYGPVYPELYEHTKYFGKDRIGRAITPADSSVARFFGKTSKDDEPYAANLSPVEAQIVEHVWKRYGHLSAIRLSELTHQSDTPWFHAYRTGGQNTILEDEQIKAHYLDIAKRASNAAQTTR